MTAPNDPQRPEYSWLMRLSDRLIIAATVGLCLAAVVAALWVAL